MKEFGKSILSLLLKGLFYLSLLVTVIGCGMLFRFATADSSKGYWIEGALSTFVWTTVIGVVGAIATSYISSKLNSSKKQNSTKDEKDADSTPPENMK